MAFTDFRDPGIFTVFPLQIVAVPALVIVGVGGTVTTNWMLLAVEQKSLKLQVYVVVTNGVTVGLFTGNSTLSNSNQVGWIGSVAQGLSQLYWDGKTICAGYNGAGVNGTNGVQCSIVTPGTYKIYVSGFIGSGNNVAEDISDNYFTITSVPTTQTPCPVGYICNLVGQTTTCPAGYTCTPVTVNCPSGYSCTTVSAASTVQPTTPTLTITSPAKGTVLSPGSTVNLAFTTDTTVKNVKFTITNSSGQVIVTNTVAEIDPGVGWTWNLTIPVTLPTDTYTVSAFANDPAGLHPWIIPNIGNNSFQIMAPSSSINTSAAVLNALKTYWQSKGM